jgi:hypothetical protein
MKKIHEYSFEFQQRMFEKLKEKQMTLINSKKKYLNWVVYFSNNERIEVQSRMFQLLAFSVGYRWGNKGKEVQFVRMPYLLIDPDEKMMYYATEESGVLSLIDNDQSKIYDFESETVVIYEFLSNPIENQRLTFEVETNGNINLNKGGEVTTIDSNTFEDIVDKRNRTLNRQDKSVIVKFKYNNKDRIVELKKGDSKYIEGIVIDRTIDGEVHEYKRFLKSKISTPIDITY